MRVALTKAFVAAVVVAALFVGRASHAADARPLVRIVLAASGEPPPWFDGFVKHLERELGLRGIDVAPVRVPRAGAGGSANTGGALAATTEAQLVVEIPAALRPVLRFTAPRDGAAARDGAPTSDIGGGRVRQVNLTGVPADGCALALAAAADELMRSNWPRAAPIETARSSDQQKDAPPSDATSAAPAQANEAPKAAPAQDAKEAARLTARSAPLRGKDTGDNASERDTAPSERGNGVGSVNRVGSRIMAAGAGETFGGGQVELGADLRWAMEVVARLELEVRGGWRTIVRRDTAHGAVDGNALLAGGGIGVVVVRGARLDVSMLGRADLAWAAYRGVAIDPSVDATSGGALGFIVSAGPRARLALTPSLGLEAEVAGGASLVATTATDAGSAVFSTKGAALLGALGLSLGL